MTHETSPADWDRLLAVNLCGAVMLCRLVVPHMLQAGYGRIIDVTRTHKGEPSHGACRASKAALFAPTRVMARELRGTGVLVNGLDPGWIRSEVSPPGAASPPRRSCRWPVCPPGVPRDGSSWCAPIAC